MHWFKKNKYFVSPNLTFGQPVIRWSNKSLKKEQYVPSNFNMFSNEIAGVIPFKHNSSENCGKIIYMDNKIIVGLVN